MAEGNVHIEMQGRDEFTPVVREVADELGEIQLPVADPAAVGSICWCGEEIEPGANHFMCYPGME